LVVDEEHPVTDEDLVLDLTPPQANLWLEIFAGRVDHRSRLDPDEGADPGAAADPAALEIRKRPDGHHARHARQDAHCGFGR
jgi:hypothetical protein